MVSARIGDFSFLPQQLLGTEASYFTLPALAETFLYIYFPCVVGLAIAALKLHLKN